MVKSETSRTYVSDISGKDIQKNEWVRLSFKLDGKSYMLDASRGEDLILDVLDHARETTRGRPSNGNGNGNGNGNTSS